MIRKNSINTATVKLIDMTVRHFRIIVVVALLTAIAGCGSSDDHGHEHDAADGHEEDHGHGDDSSSLVYTHYTATTELFVEFQALVAGQGSTFAAHVTRLDNAAPLKSGRLDVILQRGGKVAARFRVREPARTGIFTPTVTPRDPGDYRLLVYVEDGDLAATHDLGTVTVFPSADRISVDRPAPEGDISYLKEQQWSHPFASEVARMRPMRPSVPGYATVQAPADAGAEVRVPDDGYFAQDKLVVAGEIVEVGSVLGYLVPRLGGETDFGRLLVDVARTRSRLSLARRDVERLEGLLAVGAVPERRVVEAREELAVAGAEHEAALARVEQYERGSANAGIALRSPVAGEVVEVSVRPGSFVRSGERVFRVASKTRRWLDVEVPERYAQSLQRASGAWLNDAEGEARILDEEKGASVVQTSAAIHPVTRTARVTIEYPVSAGPSLIGARLPVHVFTDRAVERLAIPRSAVIDDGGREVVYVQTGGETFTRRPVELGIVDGDLVEVLAGIEAGERVASRGAYFVKLASVGGEEVGHGHAH